MAWLLDRKGPRSCCAEAENNFEVKEMSTKLSLFVKGSGPKRCMTKELHDFILREICAPNIKFNVQGVITIELPRSWSHGDTEARIPGRMLGPAS